MELSIGEAVKLTRDREKWRSLVATSSSEENRDLFRGNSSGTSNSMKLVHWPLMGGLVHLVQRGGERGCGPAQSPPRCTKCNSPLINGQCTNHRIAV